MISSNQDMLGRANRPMTESESTAEAPSSDFANMYKRALEGLMGKDKSAQAQQQSANGRTYAPGAFSKGGAFSMGGIGGGMIGE